MAKLLMINTIVEDKKCCGCAACAQRCPKHCITMEEDREGFLYPSVDESACIGCGTCDRVCPVITQNDKSEPLKVYAAKNQDNDQRELSSSGGLFIALAEKVLADDGVVFGVVFDEKWEAHHVAATTIQEVLPMMRSKYMQSRTEDAFAQAERYLKQGKRVLFTGTSCQIAGFKRFLKKEYDNLLTVDIICHGVPSPGVWRKYLQEEMKKSASCAKDQITGISFREKSRSGFSWQDFGFVIWTGNNHPIYSSIFGQNTFMRAFLSNLCLRPSCYNCPAKGGTSGSDITIADYWGIKRVLPEFYDASGVGLAIVNTQRGYDAFHSGDLTFVETSLQDATAGNPVWSRSVAKPDKRDRFFAGLEKGKTVEQMVQKCLSVSLSRRIVGRLKREIKKILKYR